MYKVVGRIALGFLITFALLSAWVLFNIAELAIRAGVN
jgi:hypothetical protein